MPILVWFSLPCVHLLLFQSQHIIFSLFLICIRKKSTLKFRINNYKMQNIFDSVDLIRYAKKYTMINGIRNQVASMELVN